MSDNFTKLGQPKSDALHKSYFQLLFKYNPCFDNLLLLKIELNKKTCFLVLNRTTIVRTIVKINYEFQIEKKEPTVQMTNEIDNYVRRKLIIDQ